MSESTHSLDQWRWTAYDTLARSRTRQATSRPGRPPSSSSTRRRRRRPGYAPRYDHPPPPPCHAAEGIYGPATDAHQRPACAQCAFHLRTIDGLQRELRRCRAELTKLHYLVVPDDAPPPLERAHGRPVMMSRPCRKFRRLDAPVLSPISRVDENNGYGDDAALELALQASLEDAARAPPRASPAPPGPQLPPVRLDARQVRAPPSK